MNCVYARVESLNQRSSPWSSNYDGVLNYSNGGDMFGCCGVMQQETSTFITTGWTNIVDLKWELY